MLAHAGGVRDLDGKEEASASRLVAVGLLLGLGAALLLTDRWFSYVDDEIVVLDVATDLSRVLQIFSGVGIHEHPPLYDLLIHFWLRWAGGATPWVRLPAVVSYLFGIWLCAAAARQIGGPRAFITTVALGTFWPFGFHHGRLAGWFSFSFLMVAWVTVAYLRLRQAPRLSHWVHLQVAGIALLYTNYFGWALLACLALDLASLRELPGRTRVALIGGTIAVTAVAFMPLLPAFVHRLGDGVGPPSSPVGVAANAIFTYFSMFTSESVAPWFWPLSLPAACLVTFLTWALVSRAGTGRRLFLFFVVLVGTMALLGVLITKRSLLISPWFIVATGAAVATPMGGRWRWWPAGALAGVFVIGWAGMVDRGHYSSHRFVEPWRAVATGSVDAMRGGALVIADNYSFLFELTQALRVPKADGRWHFVGLVGLEVAHPQVFLPQAWLDAKEPTGPRVLLIKGQAEPSDLTTIGICQQALSRRCRLDGVRRLVPDRGYELKMKLFPAAHQLPWRVEIREYACD